MRNRKYIYNPAFEADADQHDGEYIRPFTDTPAHPTTVEEFDQAEDTVHEHEEEEVKIEDERQKEKNENDGKVDLDENEDEESASEYTEAELRSFSAERLERMRWMPHRCEYGTPGGSDDTLGCPGCADAADTAIIDEGISPTQGVGDEETTDETDRDRSDANRDDNDSDMGGDLELSMLYSDYIRISDSLAHAGEFIPASEGWLGDLVGDLFGILKNAFTIVYKYARKSYKFVRDRWVFAHKRLHWMQSFWSSKLSKHLGDVDDSRLKNYEVECFTYSDWLEAAKVSINAFDLVHSGDRIVNDPSGDAIVRTMKLFADELARVGIKINIPKNRVDYDDLLDKRRFESVSDLGYAKSQMPNCIRYFQEISKRCPDLDKNTLQPKIDALIKIATSKAAQLADAVDKGDINPHSDEYRKAADALVVTTARIDFLINVMRIAFYLFDKLTFDAQKVFTAYEDCMVSVTLTDEAREEIDNR